MNFLARLTRFLFWLLLISWSVWLLRRFVGWMLDKAVDNSREPAEVSAAAQRPGAAGRLVRDPICGMHVDQALSVLLENGGELLHFCSRACRDKYAIGVQKFVANGSSKIPFEGML